MTGVEAEGLEPPGIVDHRTTACCHSQLDACLSVDLKQPKNVPRSHVLPGASVVADPAYARGLC